MKNFLDKFVVQFGIENSGLKSDAKVASDTFDSLTKKAEKTGKTVNETLTRNQKNKKKTAGYSATNAWSSFMGLPGDKRVKQTTKNVKSLSNSVEGLRKTFINTGKAILSFIPAELMTGAGALYAAKKIASFTTNIANANTPFNFLSQQLNTPVSTLSGIGQAISTIGGNPNSIVNALTSVANAQSQTRFFGTSAMNPYLNALGVPIAENGTARKPLDVLLNISKNLQEDIKNKRLNKQYAYSILAMMGFSSDVANFLMQGPAAIKAQLAKQVSQSLTPAQAKEFRQVTAASAQLDNAFSNLERNVAYDLSPAVIDLYKALTFVTKKLTGIFNPASAAKRIQALSPATAGIGRILNTALGGGTIFSQAAGGLLNQIALGESGGSGGYSAYNTGTQGNWGQIGHSGSNKNLQNMTVAQVMAWQSRTSGESALNPDRLFAAGRYQVIPSTLAMLVKKGVISAGAKFNKATQDKIGEYLLMQAAGGYITGKTNNPSGAISGLRNMWTSTQNDTNSELTSLLNRARYQYLKSHGAASNIRNNNTHAQTNIGTIVIHTQATDASGIAGELKSHIASIPISQFNRATV
jgi:hypothetical protein